MLDDAITIAWPQCKYGNTATDPALGAIVANKMWTENLSRYENNLGAVNNFYNVMKAANPAAYQKIMDSVDHTYDMNIHTPKRRK